MHFKLFMMKSSLDKVCIIFHPSGWNHV